MSDSTRINLEPNTRERKRRRPSNVREMLNDACEVAHKLILNLEPIIKENPVLDREARDQLRLATEVLKIARELHLKNNAMKWARKEVQALSGPQLEVIDTKALLQLVENNEKKTK